MEGTTTTTTATTGSRRSQAFKHLDPLDFEKEVGGFDVPLPLGPKETDVFRCGTLENGLRYYIRKNGHPKGRCALSLALRSGSIHEKDSEQGVAHILEHLAFRGTEKFSNYDIVHFLESIGADFGADQNAYTSFDETVYELFVPCDSTEAKKNKELENLTSFDRALLVLSQFAFGIRATKEDLDLERGTVLEEWRGGRSSQSRVFEAHWKATLKGSKYENRLPIGIEDVIRNVTAEEVQAFRDQWYVPQRMCVAIVGDFVEGIEEVEEKVRANFSKGSASPSSNDHRRFEVKVNEKPQILVQTDKEATQSIVNISFMQQILCPGWLSGETWTIKMYRDMIKEDLFEAALNARLFRRSHTKSTSQPFFSASCSNDHVCWNADCMALSASCKRGGTLCALEALLVELGRIRSQGFERREIEAARMELLSDAEGHYADSNKRKSEELREEYVGNFLRGEPVLDSTFEARINSTLLKSITVEEVQALALNFTMSNGMVIQTIEPPGGSKPSSTEILEIVEKVYRMESDGEIEKHPDDEQRLSAEDLLPQEELSHHKWEGFHHDIKYWPELDAKLTHLSNGMKVGFKRTKLRDEQILVYGYARGGISQVIEGVKGHPSESELRALRTAKVASLFAADIGGFGFKPSLLADALAGLRCHLTTSVRGYLRSFNGEQSSTDFVTCLKLIHLLFRTSVQAVDEELVTIKDIVRESIRNQIRDPSAEYLRRLKDINYGKSFYFKPWTIPDFDSIDAKEACEFFTKCFHNPGEFTLVVVGDIGEISGADTDESFLNMLETYLGSIKVKEDSSNLPLDVDKLVPIPFSQPDEVVNEVVKASMVDAMSETQVTIPITINPFPLEAAREKSFWIGFCCSLLSNRLMHEIRFARGKIYAISAFPSFALQCPNFGSGVARGDVSITFSCEPGEAESIKELVLNQMKDLTTNPASQEEVDSLLEMERKSYEVSLEENSFWLDALVTACQSRKYRQTGNLDDAYLFNERIREKVLKEMTPETMQSHFKHFFAGEGTFTYTAITLEPEASLASRCLSALQDWMPQNALTMQNKMVLLYGSLAAATLGASIMYYTRRLK